MERNLRPAPVFNVGQGQMLAGLQDLRLGHLFLDRGVMEVKRQGLASSNRRGHQLNHGGK